MAALTIGQVLTIRGGITVGIPIGQVPTGIPIGGVTIGIQAPFTTGQTTTGITIGITIGQITTMEVSILLFEF